MPSFQTIMEDRARAAGDFVVVVTRDRLVRHRADAEEEGCEISHRGVTVRRTRTGPIGDNHLVTASSSRTARARWPLLAAGLACAALALAGTGPSAAAVPGSVAGGGSALAGAAAGPGASSGTTGQAREANAAIAKLAASAEDVAKKLAKDAWVSPLSPGVYRLTARFGQCSGLWSHCHTGLDFAAPSGTTIRAVAAGTITSVGWAGAYGNRTVQTLRDGTEIWYCHQLTVGVRVGDSVIGGQPIGAVGSTGNSTGPHLHLEVRPGAGDAVDPFQALVFHGITP
jgi:murein DD-endopeptidase MepM/ murein hydrolase activator NlpD